MILHVVQGRPFELEIWTGGYGERPAVNLERLEYYDAIRRDSQ